MSNFKDYNNRCSGIDMLKITAMILITLIHYFGYSSISENQNLLLSNRIVITALRVLTTVAVNIFPMITGYLLYNKKQNTSRPFKLLCEGWFYSFVLMFVGLIIAGGKISPVNVLYSVFPFFTMHYWYLTAVIVLYLLSPFLNFILKSISDARLLIYISIGGTLITVYYVTNPFIISDVYIGHPRGIIWLGFLYLVGGCIKRCGINSTEAPTYKSKIFWASVALLSFTVIFAIKYLNLPSTLKNAQLLSDYAFLPFILTLSIFCLFKDLHIKCNRTVKILSRLAECSFGVYLIQEHVMIRGAYWSVFDANKYANSHYLILQLLCAVVVIWPFAYVGHFLFKKIFNLFGIKVYNAIIKAVSSLPFLRDKTSD